MVPLGSDSWHDEGAIIVDVDCGPAARSKAVVTTCDVTVAADLVLRQEDVETGLRL
jgi:hypothetical protein